jgi:hypothetical protein
VLAAGGWRAKSAADPKTGGITPFTNPALKIKCRANPHRSMGNSEISTGFLDRRGGVCRSPIAPANYCGKSNNNLSKNRLKLCLSIAYGLTETTVSASMGLPP